MRFRRLSSSRSAPGPGCSTQDSIEVEGLLLQSRVVQVQDQLASYQVARCIGLDPQIQHQILAHLLVGQHQVILRQGEVLELSTFELQVETVIWSDGNPAFRTLL